ncbi:MAG TPA: ABC transporter substrate-binding protein [Ktedonobacteraceae bacterium]|nr:ABC transporter substrate-binding protein [Ktedonobacteraceae bacterium]
MRSQHPGIFFTVLCSLMLLVAACGQQTNTTPATPTAVPDFYGTPIAFPSTPPQRIVSLIPSISENLAALGLTKRVVAVDYYTNFPAELVSLPKVSDANGKYNTEQIVSLKPDLVLSYGGETKQYDGQLAGLGLHVVDLPIANFSQSLQQILLLGRLTFTQDAATKLVNQLQQQIDQVKTAVAGTTAPKVMIELDDSTPGKPFVFGGGSFGDDLLQDANAVNIFHADTSGQGYPQVTDEAVIAANPQFIVLTEDPRFGGDAASVGKRPNWENIEAVKMNRVYNVNGDLMSRPGPRLVEGLRCVAQLVHPDKFSGSLPAYCSAAA